MVKEITINDYDYELPVSRIALHPLEERDECRLLLSSPQGRIYHRIFFELPDLLPAGTLMVCNDTRVINARLGFHKESGAAIELFLLEPIVPADYALNFQSRKSCVWKCLVGNSKKWKEGEIYLDIDNLRIKAKRLQATSDGASEVEFSWDNTDYTFGNILEHAGKIPIPPYLNRESEKSDLADYQTVYAEVKGSVAAPTAGLHFTPEVFEALAAHGTEVGKVTLHVGAGTFRPVKSEKIGEHPMHSEPFTVTRQLVEKLIEWKKAGRTVVAVGTTTVRTLESLPYIGHRLLTGNEGLLHVDQWEAYIDKENEGFDTVQALEAILYYMNKENRETMTASTSIMIAPGFKWRITDCMVTNFHQPKSTLLLLVSSFLGDDTHRGEWRKIYQEALAHDYRFLSYGDACLLFRLNQGIGSMGAPR